jgi:predicted nucleic acid-binding protein
MMVDSDVLIWYMRGNAHARRVLDGLGSFCISAVTYMEILQGIRDGEELRALKQFMVTRRVECVPIDRMMTDRAIYLMEKYRLSHGLRMGDALIAAAADIRGETLLTANTAHYRMMPGLVLQAFRPGGKS